MKNITIITALVLMMIVTGCVKHTCDLKNDTINELEEKAMVSLTYSIGQEILTSDIIKYPFPISVKADSLSNGLKYPHKMAMVPFILTDQSMIQDAGRQLHFKQSLEAAAKIMFIVFKDKDGKDWKMTLNSFEIDCGRPSDPKAKPSDSSDNTFAVMIVPTSITISPPDKMDGNVNQDDVRKAIQEQIDNPSK